MNTRKYLSTEQKILCAFFWVFFFQTWETGCKQRHLWSCTNLEWSFFHYLERNSCSSGKKKSFLCTVWDLLYPKPILPANNSLLLTEETWNTCVNTIHSFKENEEKWQEEARLIRQEIKMWLQD